MKELPKISETEWLVMKVLWKTSPLTASDVIEKLSGSVSWKPKTVKTLLSRLVQKKAISYEKDKRTYLYYPTVSENECIKAENESFVKKVYGGALNMMLASFINEKKLTREEIDELKRILEEKKI